MTRLQILRKLETAGFPMDAIVEVARDRVEIGFVTDGVVALADRDRTAQAVEVASELLGWGGFSCAWGGFVLAAGYQAEADDVAGTAASRTHY